jgi:UDP-N-acetylglucosamine/UDP-N-acetylgalactosamine 4-epimerase
MSRIDEVKVELNNKSRTWLVTGGGGFIGSNIVEALLKLNQIVVVLDNFSTGFKENLLDVEREVGAENWSRFSLIEGDIRDPEIVKQACTGTEIVLHQAALGSVPRSIDDPLTSNSVNIEGFLSVALAAKVCGVRRFVYASSSSVYGDNRELPKKEEKTGVPLSPYALTKAVNEMYADVFSKVYDFPMIGLRYFNVFGPRQTPEGPYAAVIPKWIGLLLQDKPCTIYGDGETTRDFCYVANAVQANILAAMVDNPEALNLAYNVSFGERITLNKLYEIICAELGAETGSAVEMDIEYADFRKGDVRDSLADVTLAADLLGYEPTHSLSEGMKEAIGWYVRDAKAS